MNTCPQEGKTPTLGISEGISSGVSGDSGTGEKEGWVELRGGVGRGEVC